MRVLITGANGFIGKNLQLHLANRKDIHSTVFTRGDKLSKLHDALSEVDFVFHLAGSNRPLDPTEFLLDNALLTQDLCDAVGALAAKGGKKIPVLYTSSVQAASSSQYGISKRAGEEALSQLEYEYDVPVYICRLPNIFGTWCKPNYNSVVATFCHNIAFGLPIKIEDPKVSLTLIYVDDLIKRMIELMDGADRMVDGGGFEVINPCYTTTVGELANQLYLFNISRSTLMTERVGTGLVRALYSTFMSYLPTSSFAYAVPIHNDERGVFVEMLRTPDCGQISYFTTRPGVTRGSHYHHSKTEKFLVVKGEAIFKFRHMCTHEECIFLVSSETPTIVETIPGWAHSITNIGKDEMIVILWANELFNPAEPDTYSCLL